METASGEAHQCGEEQEQPESEVVVREKTEASSTRLLQVWLGFEPP